MFVTILLYYIKRDTRSRASALWLKNIYIFQKSFNFLSRILPSFKIVKFFFVVCLVKQALFANIQPGFKYVQIKSHNYHFVEPVGAKSPTFSSESMGSIFRKRIGQGFALLCQAQSFPAPIFRQVLPVIVYFIWSMIWIAEPVGFKAPTFSTDARSISFTRTINQSFGLLCQAQAYPAPLFRQVFQIINLYHQTRSSIQAS